MHIGDDGWFFLASTLHVDTQALEAATEQIMTANAQDIAAAPGYGLTEAAIDRLKLDAGRVQAIANALREIAMLQDPIGEMIGHANNETVVPLAECL